MLRQRKAQINWKSVEGAFAKPKRLHLAKGSDGLDHCPVAGCEHVGYASQRDCRKHVKTKHGWYLLFRRETHLMQFATRSQRTSRTGV